MHQQFKTCSSLSSYREHLPSHLRASILVMHCCCLTFVFVLSRHSYDAFSVMKLEVPYTLTALTSYSTRCKSYGFSHQLPNYSLNLKCRSVYPSSLSFVIDTRFMWQWLSHQLLHNLPLPFSQDLHFIFHVIRSTHLSQEEKKQVNGVNAKYSPNALGWVLNSGLMGALWGIFRR